MAKRKPNAEVLLDAACSKHELVLAWEPGRTQPIGVNFITVNDQLLMHDRIQPDSPVVFQRLPAPDGALPNNWHTPNNSCEDSAIVRSEHRVGCQLLDKASR